MDQSKTVRLPLEITRGKTREEVVELSDLYKNAKIIRELLAGVLTSEVESAILRTESREILNCPNALASIADLHGYRRGLRFALGLLTNLEPK